MSRILFRSIGCCAALCAALALAGTRPACADTLFTFTGTFDSVDDSDAYAFDGTNYYGIPGLFDGLKGGTFRASYLVPTLVPPADPNAKSAVYNLPAPYGFSFTLYDAQGNAAMQGTGDPRYNRVEITNNIPVEDGNNTLTGYGDIVDLSGYSGTITGLETPPTLYGPPDVFIGGSEFSFLDFSKLPNIPNDITSLSLPLDAATYLGFPQHSFRTGAFLGSGDYNDQINPFVNDDCSIFYTVRGVTVTSVPEPGSFALMLGAGVSGMGLLLLRRKQGSSSSRAKVVAEPR